MLQTIELKDYRGFEHLLLEGLRPVNLIVGANNIGKTAILEALLLLHGSSSNRKQLPHTFRSTARQEEDSSYWSWLIRKGDANRNSLIRSVSFREKSVQRAGIVSTTPDDPFSKTRPPVYPFPTVDGSQVKKEARIDLGSIFLYAADAVTDLSPEFKVNVSHRSSHLADPAEVSKLYNDIAPLDADGEDAIQNFMRESIDPRVKRIRYALAPGTKTHLAYVQLAGLKESVPYSQLGQGFASTFHLYCELYANEPDLLLVDEIENGIYYQGLQDFWKGLLAAIGDRGTQLIATTHSFECMRAAHEIAKQQSEYPINYIRLDRDPEDAEKIIVTQFGKAEMDAAIENQWDMR